MSQVNKIHVESQLAERAALALDVVFLNNATFNDTALRSEIIGLFRQQVNTLAGQLRLPMDQAGWRYLTHTLKGSASAVGAGQITALAAQWELLALPSLPQSREELADTLNGALAAFDVVVEEQHLA